MTYKLTDSDFTSRLRDFLLLDTDEFLPTMPLNEDLGSIDRAKTLELVTFAEMPEERKAELLAEAEAV